MLQGIVAQQTQEVDNAETAAMVAVEDKEAAARRLANAQQKLEDAKGTQQHSLQATASPSALLEVMLLLTMHMLTWKLLAWFPILQICMSGTSLG